MTQFQSANLAFSLPSIPYHTIKPKILTLFVYLAMSAAASAEAVGIYRSVATGDDVAAVAIMATADGLPDTRVTADVDVLSGASFC